MIDCLFLSVGYVTHLKKNVLPLEAKDLLLCLNLTYASETNHPNATN